jgi:hypothetical protein
VAEKIGGWNDYRDLEIAPETDFFFRAQAAGFRAVFVPRLSVIKFSAAWRKNAYRERPSHEQAKWSKRMRSDPDFEAVQLTRVIKSMVEEIPREMPIRKLISSFVQEFGKRVAGRLARFRRVRGGEVDRNKKYKGL